MAFPKLGLPVNITAEGLDTSVEEVVEVSEQSLETSPSSESSEKSSIHKYEEEWQSLYEDEDVHLTKLRARAIGGGLRACRFRSVCWRLLLGALTPINPDVWLQEVQLSRKHYRDLKNSLTVNPRKEHKPLDVDNPLSTGTQSSWNKFFCDKELRSVIEQDVVRTFPGVDFFRSDRVQSAMTNILFCYAREHPNMCYRQGMHEILAPLLFVLHCDHQALLHTKELDPVNEVICEVLDETCFEEDSYVLFKKVMSAVQGSYYISDLTPSSTGYFPSQATPSGSPVIENQVLTQLEWIKEKLFAPCDPELYQHLVKLDISLPLFGIRWLRLLFGREFPLQDLLVLWDAIFSEGTKFQLVNYIVVAMLIAVRQQLLHSDYTSCLTLLMHYPGTMDISYIIEKALYLKDPESFSQPMTASIPQLPPMGNYSDYNKTPSELYYRSSVKERKPQKFDKNVATLTGRFKKVSTKQKWSGTPRSSMPSGDHSTVIDGYRLDDPALIRGELRHAHAVMSLCRLKLAQYYNILEQCISEENIPAQQALTGIHELCSLLDPVHITSPTSSVEVEAAYEAGESNRTSVVSPIQSPSGSNVPTNLPPPNSVVDMKIFKETQSEHIETTDNVIHALIQR